MTFTSQTSIELRKAYDKAAAANADTFTFGGQELVTNYAKYLLQYLDGAASQNRARFSGLSSKVGAEASFERNHGAVSALDGARTGYGRADE